MSILNKLLNKCKYQSGGKTKRYDTGGAFAHAGMNNDEKAAYILSNREMAMQRANMPEKNGKLLVMDKHKGVVANIYTGSYTPKKYTFNSGVLASSTNTTQPTTNYEVDSTSLTYEDAKSVASKVLKEKGRDDISEDEFAELLYYQARLESGLGTKGLGAITNNPLNWGNFGDGSRVTSFPDKRTGFETAAKGILDNYLTKGKSINDLLVPGGYKNKVGNYYDKPDYGTKLRTMIDRDKAKKNQTGGLKRKKEDLFSPVKEGEVFSLESKPATMVNTELNTTALAPVEITDRKYGWNRDIEKYRNEQNQRSPIGRLFHHKSEEKIKRQYVPRLLYNLDKNTEDLALDKVESDFINKYGNKKDKDFYKTVNPNDYLTQNQKWKKAELRAANETALDNLPRVYGVDLGNAMNMLKTTKDFIQGNWLEAALSIPKIPGGPEVDYAVNLAKDNPSGYSAKDIQDKYFYQPQLYMNNPLIPLEIGVQRMLDPTLPKLSKVNNPELQKFIIYYMTQGHDYKSALNAYNNVKQKRDIVTPPSSKTIYKDGKIVYGEKKPDKIMDFIKGIGKQREPYK